jgi:hypothetical protein
MPSTYTNLSTVDFIVLHQVEEILLVNQNNDVHNKSKKKNKIKYESSFVFLHPQQCIRSVIW